MKVNAIGGYNPGGVFKAKEDGRVTKSYQTWRDMLRRCDPSTTNKKNKSYYGCQVADEWRNFQKFAEWYELNCIEGWVLDKDVLGDGKLYSPSSCCFLPPRLNMLLVKVYGVDAGRYKGYSYHKRDGVYNARLSNAGKLIHLGYFDTEQEARQAYLTAKKNLIVSITKEYHHLLRPHVRDALYTMEIG